MNKTLKRFATALAAGAITISMLGCTQSGGNQESNAQAKDSNVQDVKESAASGEENTALIILPPEIMRWTLWPITHPMSLKPAAMRQ